MTISDLFILELARAVLRRRKRKTLEGLLRAHTLIRDLSPDKDEVLRSETFLAEASA